MLNKIESATGGKKIAIGMACLLFLVLAFPVLGKEQLRKPANTPPVLEKITFVHYAKGTKNIPPVADDTFDRFKLLYGGIKWADIMQYEVNLSGSDFNSQPEKGQAMTALSVSLETWDAAIAETSSSFELFAAIDTTNKNSVELDNVNLVMWDDLSLGIIAMNSLWFNPATKEILESDVVLNTDYAWSVSEDCSDTAMDLQNIATHEFGHNGLGDLYSPPTTALTMYGYSDYGDTEKRTLGTGDTNGIQALYGTP